MGDVVKNPDHYCAGRKYEPRKVIHDWGLNFNLGSAVKYISRAGRKDDILQDLKKAKQFLEFEIEELESKKTFDALKSLATDDLPTTEELWKTDTKEDPCENRVNFSYEVITLVNDEHLYNIISLTEKQFQKVVKALQEE